MDYASILTQSWDEVPTVKLLPGGSFQLKCLGASVKPPKSADKSASVQFIYQPLEPLDDVDEVGLSQLGADYDFSSNRIFHRMWLKDGSDLQRIRTHLAKHGVTTAGMTVEQSLKAVKGSTVIGLVGVRTYTADSGEVVEENTLTSFIEAN
jgi:hypothetical protein